MYLLDTSFLIDLAREKHRGAGRATGFLMAAPESEILYLSTVALAQLCVGEHLAKSQRARRRAAQFREWLLALCAILPFDQNHAVEFGRIAAELRSKGRLIPESDIQIAASAISDGLRLVTRNHKHFAEVSGLAIQPF